MSTGDPIFTTPVGSNRASSRALALHYLGTENRYKDPVANPIRAGAALLRKLPPVFIFIGDRETILGGSEHFMSKLQGLGRKDDALQVYSGMWHVFPMYSAGCGSGQRLSQGDAAVAQTGRFLQGARPSQLAPRHLPVARARLVLLRTRRQRGKRSRSSKRSKRPATRKRRTRRG